MKVSVNGSRALQLARQLQQALLLDAVDLVERQDQRRLAALQLGQDALHVLVDPLGRIDHQHHDVGVARPAPGRLHHGPVETAARGEDAGRVDEHELARALDGDAAQRHARRLHLVADDRDLGPDQRIDQGRLAGVGRTDDRDEAAAGLCPRRRLTHRPVSHTPSRTSSAVAAACSAARLFAPSPRAGFRPLMRTSEVKRGAWSGPWRSTSTIVRQIEALALRPLLQRRLGVGGLGCRRSLELAAPVPAHHRARLVVAGLQEDGAEQRLAGVRQDRLLVAPAAAGFRLAQHQRGPEIERARHVGAGAAAHQAVVEAGELALVGRRVDLAQQLGDGEPQHPVAQELEPLVVAALGRGLAHAGMRQRLLEQRRDP